MTKGVNPVPSASPSRSVRLGIGRAPALKFTFIISASSSSLRGCVALDERRGFKGGPTRILSLNFLEFTQGTLESHSWSDSKQITTDVAT